jgi:hypothetical protein
MPNASPAAAAPIITPPIAADAAHRHRHGIYSEGLLFPTADATPADTTLIATPATAAADTTPFVWLILVKVYQLGHIMHDVSIDRCIW